MFGKELKLFLNVHSCSACLYLAIRYSTAAIQPRISIIGSGPSGFVVAQTLLKNHETAKIDMYEKLPLPFGLIRYGVSPDHQDVKNCINGYTKTAESDRFSFFGNVNVGKDISLSELCNSYHAVVLCTGAQGEQKLGIIGENLKNVFTSNQFVGWYNGMPEYQNLDIDLSGKTAVIVGVGNVALDVARMLVKPIDQLKDTDVPSEALQKLSKSNIRNVYILGRRGPLQMACTRRELSEITDLPEVETFIEPEHYQSIAIQNGLKKKDLSLRKIQRLIKYLQKVAVLTSSETQVKAKSFHVKLLRSPLQLNSKDSCNVSSMTLLKRVQEGEDAFNPIFKDTDATEEINCDLVVSCIGYKNIPLDPTIIPFENGKIIQKKGLVNLNKGLYASGWCSHGPKGVLADSGLESASTGSSVLSDLPTLTAKKSPCDGSLSILKLLTSRNINYVTWKGWVKIDKYEIKTGEKQGKVREKVLSYDEMISLASD